MSIQLITIKPDEAGQRIDNFLMTRVKGVPKSRLYRAVRKGEVRINKKRVAISYRLQANDIVRVPPLRQAEPKTHHPSQNLSKLLQDNILYEDEGLLILNKPLGMPVHAGSGVSLGVIEALRAIRADLHFLDLVHRLDKATSGCLILAKKRSMLRTMHQLFREDQIQKVYHCLVKGRWRDQLRRVDKPLQKNTLQSGERIVKVDSEGKTALTEFQLLHATQEVSLLAAILHTGRTHQIRVHAASVGHPIVGDAKYGNEEFNKMMQQRGLKRMFLHAAHLEFTLPNGLTIAVDAPLDEEWLTGLAQCHIPY